MAKPNNLELIAQRAKSAGYQYGDYAERDKERGRTRFDKKTLAAQNQMLDVYLAWCSNATGVPLEQCDTRFLSQGVQLPKLEELKDFWRFFALQSSGRLTLPDGSKTNRPTVVTLRGKAKVWKSGFLRRTGQQLSEEETAEINRWLKDDLPYEETSEGNPYCHNLQKPKFNFQSGDLDRLIDQIWSGQDTRHIYDRNRLQFHLQLLWFCDAGARRGALLKHGVPYKDIHLVLSPHQGWPQFFYKLAQRHVKNNKDPDLRTFGNTCRQHPVLRYDSVSIILMLAVVDGALNREDLTRMMENGGEGHVEWSKQCRDLPICRSVDQQGEVHETKPMTQDSFIEMFKMFLMQAGYTSIPGYLFLPGSIHMIRRELGKQLDGLYTEVERSQHLTQADKAVFGQSYTADTSSCDGLSAFLREKPDHRAVEYFQGLAQFRHEGLPTQLPAALKDEISRNPAVLEWDRKITQTSDKETRKEAMQKRQKTVDKLQKIMLEEHRREFSASLKRHKLFNGRQAQLPNSDLDDPIHELRPEMARLAQKMTRTSPASQQDRLDAMEDMLSLLAAPTVYYRPGEEPQNGKCPYCSKEIQSISDRRAWCKHIHRCRKKAEAEKREVQFSTLRFCYFCNLYLTGDEWGHHCENHLTQSLKHCGSITFRHTLIRPAFCLICRQMKYRTPATRMRYWARDSDAIYHMEEEHEWPWSCPDCNFIGKSSEACYHHLHDAHGYQLAKKRKHTGPSPVDTPDNCMSKLVRFTASSPEVSGTDLTFNGPLEIVESTKNEVDAVDTIVDDRSLLETPNPRLSSSAMSSTANLDLASTAKSSLALLGGCSWDNLTPNIGSPAMKPSVYDTQREDGRRLPTDEIAMDTNPVGDSFSPCGVSRLPTPCATTDTDTGSATPSPVTSEGKKRRIKFITTAHKSEPTDDIESPPAPKKCRITLKIKPRTVSGKEHAGGDIATVQGWDKQTEIEKATKTRIVLKTGSCQPYSRRPTTPLKTWLSGTASSRSRWTLEEDERVCRMKQDNCSWAKIQRALPHRSQGSIQVRYSTKLNKQIRGDGH
ncbi:hypothetical protein BFJ66_g971 [Fusarium oxysporum f. sp. cepae]|uniref:Myb-like domain-containing protein n=1 Tax=Fusarium oxysporum f. sp. cepae TaxID=396571 RepID=A0A3L6NIZ6_FUSOX|nr:hypothetical protein BFJ65_g8473 [Fusarium oxysporum f. sp. cepae]RKK62163.1 hypothetical protein BFJ66_g971 [Fusarium oxysporum f. sp. cepae]